MAQRNLYRLPETNIEADACRSPILQQLVNRPEEEHPLVILPVGYPRQPIKILR